MVLKLFLILFAALALLVSCSNLLEIPAPVPLAPGMGRAVISLGGGGTRTLIPETPVFAKYALAFAASGKTTVSEDLTDPGAISSLAGSGYAVDLEPGTWELIVTAYTRPDPASDYLEAAKNTVPVSVSIAPGASEAVAVTIDHLPVDGTKKGIFSWDIVLPALGPVDSAELIYATQGGLSVTEDLKTAASGAAELDSGRYVVTILLTKDGKTAGRTEGAHVYPGLTTRAGANRPEFTVFTDADFVSMKYLAGTAAIVKPGALDVNPLQVRAYADSAYALPIVTDPALTTVLAGQWSMKVPVTQGDVYFRLETSGGGRSFNAAAGQATGAPDNGKPGIPLSITIYALSQTITGSSYGSVGMSVDGQTSAYAIAGETVVLTASPNPGYGLKAGTLQVNGSAAGMSGSGPYDFVMPAADVTVTAEFAAIASYTARRGTTFYMSLKDAIDAATTGSASSPDEITLLKSITLPEVGTEGYAINNHIKLVSNGSGADIITRETGFSDSLFTVGSGASLALDGSLHALVIDGNNISATAALIAVEGGTLNMGDGVTLKNNWNTTTTAIAAHQGGGARVADGGSFTMNGGTISGNTIGNTTNGNGGGVYVSGTGSRFEMQGGTIGGSGLAKNTAANGGGIMVGNGAFFVMTAGSITGNKAANGGAVFNSNAAFTMITGSITENDATGYGGAVYIIGASSRFEMQGGAIGGSGSAKNTAGNGNGVYVGNSGEFAMSGIASLMGNGVYVKNTAASVSIEGQATVDPVNDRIYLESGKFVTLSGDLSGTGIRARLQPETSASGTKVLDGAGTLVPHNKAKFAVIISSIPYPGASCIDDNGQITAP
jgi:hypothetical protein